MKGVVDYLKEKGKFEGHVGKINLVIKMHNNLLIMTCGEYIHTCKIVESYDVQEFICNILENYNTEVRFCEECGKPYDTGYIAGDGDWYCCEDCFEGAMNRDYGEGKWRGTDEEGYYGGYYEHLEDNGKWEDTGIYYTEWN